MELALAIMEKPAAVTADRISVPPFSRRVAWTSDGWYITLRNEDARLSEGYARHHADVRTIGGEVVAGPFRTREALMTWFGHFVAAHGRSRNPEEHGDYLAFSFA